jgi:hypothetical protein
MNHTYSALPRPTPQDSAERKRFSQNSHEYLIQVLQHTGPESIAPGTTSKTSNYRLNFNHPCKTLWWAVKDASKYGKFTTGATGTTDDRYAPIQSVKLQLNGTCIRHSRW